MSLSGKVSSFVFKARYIQYAMILLPTTNAKKHLKLGRNLLAKTAYLPTMLV